MKKILRLLIVVQIGIWFSLTALVEKPEQIEDTIKGKNKAAQEAQSKANEARKAAQEAQIEADSYKALSQQYENKNINLYQDAKKKQQQFTNEAKINFALQKTEEDKSTKYLEEAKSLELLQKEQNAIANTFIESSHSKNDILEEQFEHCLENFITKNVKKSPIRNESYNKLLKSLADKLKELEVYERSTFYKSSTITEEQWEKIHKEALKGKGNYEIKYKQLLQSLETIKKDISNLLREKNTFLPSKSQINECFIQNYPSLDKKLKALEKTIAEENEEESSPWN